MEKPQCTIGCENRAPGTKNPIPCDRDGASGALSTGHNTVAVPHFLNRAQRCRCALFVSLASREEPFHLSSGLVTETIPERRSGRSKSRPPHALIESRLNSYNYQITLDWTTSFLSDNYILRLRAPSCQDVFMSG